MVNFDFISNLRQGKMQKDKFRYIRKNTKAKETGTTKGSVSNEISQRG